MLGLSLGLNKSSASGIGQMNMQSTKYRDDNNETYWFIIRKLNDRVLSMLSAGVTRTCHVQEIAACCSLELQI